jgi:hypothetical protein
MKRPPLDRTVWLAEELLKSMPFEKVGAQKAVDLCFTVAAIRSCHRAAFYGSSLYGGRNRRQIAV